MNHRLVKPASIGIGALLLATQAFAQGTAQPADAATSPDKAPRDAQRGAVAAAPVAAAAPAAAAAATGGAGVTIVTAAGSVIVLVNGVVARAHLAQIAPPAPGFVYER